MGTACFLLFLKSSIEFTILQKGLYLAISKLHSAALELSFKTPVYKGWVWGSAVYIYSQPEGEESPQS